MDWRRALVYTHRWLGIAGCLLFLAWFASGIVMIYARMPEVGSAERLARARPVDWSAARVSLADAWRGDAAPDRLRLVMLTGRPTYLVLARGRWTAIFADDGRTLDGLTRDQALDEARRFAPDHAATVTYDARLTEPDQWTLQSPALLPMHRIALGDPDGTVVYVSDRTAAVEMKTTRRERLWAYAGPVTHWIYFTPLRKQSALWAQTIIWLSVAGCLMCISGLVWGFIAGCRSPYTGMMRWHHYAGLIAGVVTFTWIFSGLLSMDPWDWHPSTSPSRAQREGVAGGSLALEPLTIDRARRALSVLAAGGAVKEAEIIQFRGEPFLASGRTLVSAVAPERGLVEHFDEGAIAAAARAAMPGTPVEEISWLRAYDSYYYDRDGALPLPVLRARFADEPRTWLYLDPARGAIVRKEERLSRLNRWLYHGLHSLDFPFLYGRRPLWDSVVIVLSIGGLVSAITSLTPAWRRLRRHLRRFSSTRARDVG